MNFSQEHDFGEVISRYIDNELNESEKSLIASHLKECRKCRSTYDQFMANERLIEQSLKYEIFGSQLVESVMKRLKTEGSVAKVGLITSIMTFLRSYRHVATAASLVFLLALVIYLLNAVNQSTDRLNSLEKDRQTKNDYTAMLERQLLNLHTNMAKLSLQKFIKNYNDADIAAYQNRDFIVISAAFKNDDLELFNLYKRKMGGKWIELAAGLNEPSFVDYETTPGTYEYQFEGIKRVKSGEGITIYSEKSSIIRKEIEYTGTTIKFVSFDPNNNSAVFSLKDVDSHQQRIMTLKHDEVMFNYRLVSVQLEDRILYCTIPVYERDEQTGKPVIDQDTGKPKIRRYDTVPVSQKGNETYKAKLVNIKTLKTLTLWLGEEHKID